MAKLEPPFIGLARYGRQWVPNIFFTSSRDREEFLRLADWLCRDFHAEVVERYGGHGEDHKEYWTLKVNDSEWLLMRCYYPHGISLGSSSMKELPAFEAIARHVSAAPLGWRYRWLLLRRRFGMRRRENNDSATAI